MENGIRVFLIRYIGSLISRKMQVAQLAEHLMTAYCALCFTRLNVRAKICR